MYYLRNEQEPWIDNWLKIDFIRKNVKITRKEFEIVCSVLPHERKLWVVLLYPRYFAHDLLRISTQSNK